MSSDAISIASGLDAIFGVKRGDDSIPNRKQILYVAIEKLQPSRVQPRKFFDPEKIEELARSIEKNGILQPLIVREKEGVFEIIAGERRFLASKKIGLTEIPVVIENVDDNTALAFALIENIQRENLNAVEEARTYQKLIQDLGVSHEEVGQRVGKSRPFISNYLRILSLNEEVLRFLEQGKISMGHAKALLSLESERQKELVNEIIEKDLSVREVEKRAQNSKKMKEPQSSFSNESQCQHWASRLSKKIASKVDIKLNAAGEGRVIIHVKSSDELEWLIDHIHLTDEN